MVVYILIHSSLEMAWGMRFFWYVVVEIVQVSKVVVFALVLGHSISLAGWFISQQVRKVLVS